MFNLRLAKSVLIKQILIIKYSKIFNYYKISWFDLSYLVMVSALLLTFSFRLYYFEACSLTFKGLINSTFHQY